MDGDTATVMPLNRDKLTRDRDRDLDPKGRLIHDYLVNRSEVFRDLANIRDEVRNL